MEIKLFTTRNIRISVFFALTLFTFTQRSFCQWVATTDGINMQPIASMYFSAGVGYAVGGANPMCDYNPCWPSTPEILKTTDYVHWVSQTVPNGAQRLIGVFFLDANNGYAVGDSGTIIHTSNGGVDWALQTSGTLERLVSVYFLNSTDGWTAGWNGTILKTTNAGATWSPLNSGTTGHLSCVQFTSSQTGFVGGRGEFLKTINGGNTWTPISEPPTSSTFQFFNSNDGYAMMGNGLLSKTTDGGANWNGLNYPWDSVPGSFPVGNHNNGPREFHFSDVNTGLISSNYGEIALTTDGGSTWHVVLNGDTLVSVFSINKDIAFASSSNHVIYSSKACNAHFTLSEDVSTPHHWYLLNEGTGLPPVTYSWNWGDGSNPSIGDTVSHVYNAPGYYNICLTVNDNAGCSSTYCDSSTYLRSSRGTMVSVNVVSQIPVATSIATTESDNFSFKIYPNPASNNFILEVTSAGSKEFQLFDITGRMLLSQVIQPGKTTIDASGLAIGIYQVSLKNANGITTKKLVIDR